MIVVRVGLGSNIVMESKSPKLPSNATLVRALEAKATSSMVVTLFGMVTLVRSLPRKTFTPMVVTLSGIITLVRALLAKA